MARTVRINKGDYVTVTGVGGLTKAEVWRLNRDADVGWTLYRYTESIAGFENGYLPNEFLDWDRWEVIATYWTKREAMESLPL